jgi:PTH1 family peptidyl-tRNA hydrolase
MAIDRVIVGLGNPGPRYERTRHNAGFMLLHRIAAGHGIALRQERHGALVGEGAVAGRRCLLALPQAFMNRSGESVQRILAFTGVEPAAMLLAHDELDLPLGRLRLRSGGGAGGHRGVASVLAHLGGAEFGRLRMGVGRPPEGLPAEAYVLQEFAAAERAPVEEMLARAAEAAEAWVALGLEAAMNRFNAAGAAPPG